MNNLTFAEIAAIVTMIGVMVGGFWGVLTLAGRQFEKGLDEKFHAQDKRLDERFATQESSRAAAKADWDKHFEALAREQQEFSKEQRRLERELQAFREVLPRDYWRREDAIRNDTMIDAKLDAINARLDHWITLQKVAS